jgi:hypothetical protein
MRLDGQTATPMRWALALAATAAMASPAQAFHKADVRIRIVQRGGAPIQATVTTGTGQQIVIGGVSAAPVSYNAAPVTLNAAPVTYSAAPVTYSAAPVSYNAAPVTLNAAPAAASAAPAASPGSFILVPASATGTSGASASPGTGGTVQFVVRKGEVSAESTNAAALEKYEKAARQAAASDSTPSASASASASTQYYILAPVASASPVQANPGQVQVQASATQVPATSTSIIVIQGKKCRLLH